MQDLLKRSSLQRMRLALPLSLLVAGLLAGGTAVGQDLGAQLDAKRGQLDQAEERKGVLSTEIEQFTEQITQLQGEVAVLRNREAAVAEELRETQAQLVAEVARLEALRERLSRSIVVLRQRLVAIYKSDEPDVLTVILDADGFDDLVSRYEYLDRVQDQDASIVGRVRDLRTESQETVHTVREARNAIAARKAELERTRSQLEGRQAELDSARDSKAAALDEVGQSIQRLEGDIGDIEADIQAQLREAQASTTESDPLPAGPVQGASNGFIWPVTGTVTSPFGPRWGRLHAGIDIAAPGGTPIRAAKAGRIVIAEPYGGYGNYTCIDHGGGLSTCYAHQSALAITSGSVEQGDVIGYVGNTGASFGDHLHFEVRVDGTPVDPFGYL